MTFASASQFHVYTYCGVKARVAYCLNSVLNVKALIGAFNQEKALVGAFSVIVQFHRFNCTNLTNCLVPGAVPAPGVGQGEGGVPHLPRPPRQRAQRVMELRLSLVIC